DDDPGRDRPGGGGRVRGARLVSGGEGDRGAGRGDGGHEGERAAEGEEALEWLHNRCDTRGFQEPDERRPAHIRFLPGPGALAGRRRRGYAGGVVSGASWR